MTYEEYRQYLAKEVMYESRYKDTEGRSVLVICELDALAMVNDLVRAEREACAKVCKGITSGWVGDTWVDAATRCAAAIRARGEK